MVSWIYELIVAGQRWVELSCWEKLVGSEAGIEGTAWLKTVFLAGDMLMLDETLIIV